MPGTGKIGSVKYAEQCHEGKRSSLHERTTASAMGILGGRRGSRHDAAPRGPRLPEARRPAAQPCPRRFPCSEARGRSAGTDTGSVRHYSVPRVSGAHRLGPRWDTACADLHFASSDRRMRHGKGRFSTHAQHPHEKINGTSAASAISCGRCDIGPHTCGPKRCQRAASRGRRF
jgi:hypothetical protein